MIFGTVFGAAFVLALLMTPVIRRAALRCGVVDQPATRKMHHVPIPLLGGGAIVLSVVAVMSYVWIWAPEVLGEEAGSLPPLLLGALLIGLLGAYDDWKGSPVVFKFVVQFGVAAVLVFAGVQARFFTNPLGESVSLGWVGAPLTILWIVGVTNAMNLIDGLDGLAAGIGTIAALSLCGVAAASDHPLVTVMALVLAGSTLGFLPYNLYPARIFLGDTGSMFLGFLLAALGVVGSLKATTATVLIIPIVVLGIPVFDTLWAILRRTRMMVSPFKADRDHIHHRLVRVGLHHRHVVLVLYFLCAFLGVSATVIVQLPSQTGFVFAVLLAMGGAFGVWTLKYIDDQLEARLAAATGDSSQRRNTPPPGAAISQWGAGNGHRPSADRQFQVSLCEVGRFREGWEAGGTFPALADHVRDVLSRRIRVFSVSALLQEDRSLLLVLSTEPLKADGSVLVKEALLRFFGEQSGPSGIETPGLWFRWVRMAGQREVGRPAREATAP